jgi:hypothetical protein
MADGTGTGEKYPSARVTLRGRWRGSQGAERKRDGAAQYAAASKENRGHSDHGFPKALRPSSGSAGASGSVDIPVA